MKSRRTNEACPGDRRRPCRLRGRVADCAAGDCGRAVRDEAGALFAGAPQPGPRRAGVLQLLQGGAAGERGGAAQTGDAPPRLPAAAVRRPLPRARRGSAGGGPRRLFFRRDGRGRLPSADSPAKGRSHADSGGRRRGAGDGAADLGRAGRGDFAAVRGCAELL